MHPSIRRMEAREKRLALRLLALLALLAKHVKKVFLAVSLVQVVTCLKKLLGGAGRCLKQLLQVPVEPLVSLSDHIRLVR